MVNEDTLDMFYSLTILKNTKMNIEEHRFKSLPDNTCLLEDKTDENIKLTILALK